MISELSHRKFLIWAVTIRESYPTKSVFQSLPIQSLLESHLQPTSKLQDIEATSSFPLQPNSHLKSQNILHPCYQSTRRSKSNPYLIPKSHPQTHPSLKTPPSTTNNSSCHLATLSAEVIDLVSSLSPSLSANVEDLERYSS